MSIITIKRRKSYDTRIKYLVREGLLPSHYKGQIHRSLISKWKKEPWIVEGVRSLGQCSRVCHHS